MGVLGWLWEVTVAERNGANPGTSLSRGHYLGVRAGERSQMLVLRLRLEIAIMGGHSVELCPTKTGRIGPVPERNPAAGTKDCLGKFTGLYPNPLPCTLCSRVCNLIGKCSGGFGYTSEKHLLAALANDAPDENQNCWPKIKSDYTPYPL